ncbi:hypothetical protein BH10PLA2_BH10PLA2_07540 [soil metagenome]
MELISGANAKLLYLVAPMRACHNQLKLSRGSPRLSHFLQISSRRLALSS